MKTKSASPFRAFLAAPRRRFFSALLLPLVAAGFSLAPVHGQTITSAVPGLISYQGKVSNANGTLVGAGTAVNRTVTFRIWSHQSNSTVGDLVYSEQQTVTISEGEFSVLVGQGTAVSGTPLGYSETAKGPSATTVASAAVFGGAVRYLGVTIDDGTGAADPEVSPRQQLVTSAFAFRAKYAETVGSNGNSTLTVTDAGNVGIGFATPGAPLTFAPGLGEKIRFYGNFDAGIGVQSGNIQFRGSNAADDLTFGHGPSASMTETMRIKGNGNVGIGTNNPTAKLDVNGVLNVFDGAKSYPAGIATEVGSQLINFGINDGRFGTQNTALAGGFMRVDARGTTFGGPVFQFLTRAANAASASTSMVIDASGNVGIGNSSPTSKLHVNGGITSTSLTTGALNLTGPIATSGLVTTHTQGAYLEWNKSSGGGQTYLLNQRGPGPGGIIFGEVTSADAITENMRITAGGNVGIGLSSPGFPLNFPSTLGDKISLFGNSGAHYGFGVQGGLFQIHTDASTADVVFGYGTSAAMTETMRIKGSGRVGIGTSSPGAQLDVIGTVRSTAHVSVANVTTHEQGAWLEWNKPGSDGVTYLLNQKGGGPGGIVFGEVSTANVITERMRINQSGYVGIGTSAPSAPLHVTTTASVASLLNAYMDGDAVTTAPHQQAYTGNYSIIADGRIRSSQGFDVHSDRRIKNVVGLSSGRADLAALMRIEITDFTFKDKVAQSARPQKKVIAQQVESIFPSAVTSVTQVVPDIFESAAIADGWIELATDLKVGEKVRLVAQENDGLYEVTGVAAGRFRTTLNSSGTKLFVYGREVKDFRVVDYDAIAMLNVSATQEIKREKDAEVAALRTANAALTARVAELEAKDRARDAQLASIEKLLRSSSTVMAQPAKPTSANGQE